MKVDKKKKKTGGTALLSFGGEEGEDGLEPVAKKAKLNSKPDAKPTKRRASSSVQSPPPQAQLPLPREESPSRSPTPSSPEPEQVGRVSSTLEQTNAHIAELKASMKRNLAAPAPKAETQLSALQQLIPANAVRGKKRRQGAQEHHDSDPRTLKVLNAFRAKLSSAPAETVREPSPSGHGNDENAAGGRRAANDDEEASLCDLHFIANCQSCESWDKHVNDRDEVDDDDSGWMSHALSFERDRLGKDLKWRKQNEGLAVIDPMEKAKGIRHEQRSRRDENRQKNSNR